MIRAHRIAAQAQDDAGLISGWNIAPNIDYTLILAPSLSACGVLLYDADMSVLIASGAALVGDGQPCVLIPQQGDVGMVDAELGWHLLLSTVGTEAQREIHIGPSVDLPDENHPIYADDDLTLARATAAIDAAAHYSDVVTVSCPLGLGAGLGDVVGVPVDGVAVVGQIESIQWTATPAGAIDTAVIRRHIAIAPDPFFDPAPIIPPTVSDDTSSVYIGDTIAGNVLDNDDSDLFVSAVYGFSGNVGQQVAGSTGGLFTVSATGAWTFDPGDDFSEEAQSSITYHANDGVSESMATLSVNIKPKQIEFVGMSTGGATNGAAFNIAMPPEVHPGDLVVVVQALMWTSNKAVGPTTPGYTIVADLYADDTRDMNLGVAFKIMGDPVDEVVSMSPTGSSSYPTAAALHVWRGVDQASPLDVSRTTATGINSGTPNPPAILPVTEGAIILICDGEQSSDCWELIYPTEYENIAYVCRDNGNSIAAVLSSVVWDGVSVYNASYSRPSNSNEEPNQILKSWASCALALRPA